MPVLKCSGEDHAEISVCRQSWAYVEKELPSDLSPRMKTGVSCLRIICAMSGGRGNEGLGAGDGMLFL